MGVAQSSQEPELQIVSSAQRTQKDVSYNIMSAIKNVDNLPFGTESLVLRNHIHNAIYRNKTLCSGGLNTAHLKHVANIIKTHKNERGIFDRGTRAWYIDYLRNNSELLKLVDGDNRVLDISEHSEVGSPTYCVECLSHLDIDNAHVFITRDVDAKYDSLACNDVICTNCATRYFKLSQRVCRDGTACFKFDNVVPLAKYSFDRETFYNLLLSKESKTLSRTTLFRIMATVSHFPLKHLSRHIQKNYECASGDGDELERDCFDKLYNSINMEKIFSVEKPSVIEKSWFDVWNLTESDSMDYGYIKTAIDNSPNRVYGKCDMNDRFYTLVTASCLQNFISQDVDSASGNISRECIENARATVAKEIDQYRQKNSIECTVHTICSEALQ